MDKLLEALKLIREECEKHTECKSCPMYDVEQQECGLFFSPRKWEIRDSVKVTYSVIGDD